MRNDDNIVDNFIFNCMTQAELGLDGQEPGRMAESLRSILQGAFELHAGRTRQAAEVRGLRPITGTYEAEAC